VYRLRLLTERWRIYLELTSVMPAQRQEQQPTEGAKGLGKITKKIQWDDLMALGKSLSAFVGTSANVLWLVIVRLYWVVVKNFGAVNHRSTEHCGTESSERSKESNLSPLDIATKATQSHEDVCQDEVEVAECPNTPVIARQDTNPVLRRISTPEVRHVSTEEPSPKVKKTNTFVMVEYRDGSDIVSFCENSSSNDSSSDRNTITTTSTDCIDRSSFNDTPDGQQYVVVEVPRDDDVLNNNKKKKKKKKRAKVKKEENIKTTQSSSHDTRKICENPGSHFAQVAAVEVHDTHKSSAATLAAEVDFLNLSTDSSTLHTSNTIFREETSMETRTLMSEQQHESELEKAWRTASLSAAKLGLDTFSEDTSLTRQPPHPILTSDSLNSSKLSQMSWTTSLDSSLSFGSPLRSTSDKKSSSFKNIKDIWDKTAL